MLQQPAPAQAGPPHVKRQQEYIQEDVWRCCNPDINRPFSSFQDAVDRLLPYHVLSHSTMHTLQCLTEYIVLQPVSCNMPA